MKKYLIAMLCIVFCSISIAGYSKDVNEKVLRSFNQTFPDAQNVVWRTFSEKNTAQFMLNGIRTVVNYDMDGNFLDAIRYYTENNLPLNIIRKLKAKYPSKKIYGVTEESTTETVNYYVKLEDETSWVTVKADADGNSEVVEKYYKQK